MLAFPVPRKVHTTYILQDCHSVWPKLHMRLHDSLRSCSLVCVSIPQQLAVRYGDACMPYDAYTTPSYKSMLNPLSAHSVCSAVVRDTMAEDSHLWERRPLPVELQQYAAADVCQLLALADRLVEVLGEVGVETVSALSQASCQLKLPIAPGTKASLLCCSSHCDLTMQYDCAAEHCGATNVECCIF